MSEKRRLARIRSREGESYTRSVRAAAAEAKDPTKLQQLRNAGSLADQRLRNTGQMNVQGASDRTALERLGIKNKAASEAQQIGIDAVTSESKIGRLADLEKPNYQKIQTGIGADLKPIYEWQNINTAKKRAQGKNAGTASKDSMAFLRGDSRGAQDAPYTLNAAGVYTNIPEKGHNKLSALSTDNLYEFSATPSGGKPDIDEGKSFFSSTAPSTVAMTPKLASLGNEPQPIIEAFRPADVSAEEISARRTKRQKRMGSLGRMRNPYSMN